MRIGTPGDKGDRVRLGEDNTGLDSRGFLSWEAGRGPLRVTPGLTFFLLLPLFLGNSHSPRERGS